MKRLLSYTFMDHTVLRLFSGLAFVCIAAIPLRVLAIPVFVNEIHYDNSSTDTGEAIEIAGPAGTDLTGWSIVLYNGSNGASYNTTPLSGSIPDEGGGFGTVSVSYPVNGIQNGAPDGIALVDSGSNVAQFLSYEGTFTATDGPALGLMSTNIGVSETSSTPVGTSLQLIGPGRDYEDFTWFPPSASDAVSDSFGLINTDQLFLATFPTPTELFISEMVEGSSFNKVLELANFTGAPVDLDAGEYEIEIYFNGSATPGFVLDLTGVIPNGDVFVIAHTSADSSILALADALFSTLLFNGDDAIVFTMGGSIIDVIGQVGFDPGGQWGSLLVSTQDNTLIRKPTVFGGDTNAFDAFNPYVEWLGFAQDSFDGLGTHSISQVPEPTVLLLTGVGIVGLAVARRRRLHS